MQASTHDLGNESPVEFDLAERFEYLRPRLLAIVQRRISAKLAARLDPEGILHDAFIRALSRWAKNPCKPAQVNAWIYRQVLDQLTEATRAALGTTRDAARDVPLPEESAFQLDPDVFGLHNRPSAALSAAERSEMLQAAMQKLDPIDREILTLRYFDDLGFDEIAELLGFDKANTANARALRALRKLRKFIPSAHRPPGESSS